LTGASESTGPPRLPTVGLGCGNFGEFLGATQSRQVVEAALERLGRDWIDFYLFHHPDPRTPLTETLAAMAELRGEGKVRAIGCSNFSPAQLEGADAAARALGVEGFAVAQNAYSLLDRTAERELLPTSAKQGMAFVPYLPLAGGMLTGKYRRDGDPDEPARMSRELRGAPVRDYFPALLSDECFGIVDSLTRFAADHGHSLLELAFGWLLSSPVVSGVIAGATSPRQLQANIAAIAAWELSADERAAVDRLTRDDVAFAWHPGMPEYTQPPAGTLTGAPDLRQNVARER
jgi:aryl-alcohol dehydrogenase-like predicted oxidoreductase